jgi:hypothetical protein
MSKQGGEQGRGVFLREGCDVLEGVAQRVICMVTLPKPLLEDSRKDDMVWKIVIRNLLLQLEARRGDRIPDEHKDRVLGAIWIAVMGVWSPGSPKEIASDPDIHWPSEAVWFFLGQLGKEGLKNRLDGTGLLFAYDGDDRNSPTVGSVRCVLKGKHRCEVVQTPVYAGETARGMVVENLDRNNGGYDLGGNI